MSIDIRKIKAGDWVSATIGYADQPESHATLSGVVYADADILRLGPHCLLGVAIHSIDEHKPARRVGDLKISPDGLPVAYVGKCTPLDTDTWLTPHPTSGYAEFLTDDEVATWPDMKMVEK